MRLNVYFTDEFSEKLKTRAKSKGMRISEYIRYALIRLWVEEK